jgi:hypothetical protein
LASPSRRGPAPSEAAAEAFLAAHQKDAPPTHAGINMYPHHERVEYVRAWLRAAYAVDFPGRAPLGESPAPPDVDEILRRHVASYFTSHAELLAALRRVPPGREQPQP